MGKIKVTENCNGIEGLKVIEPAVFGDARGYFMETYNYNDFAEAGIDCQFVQDNQSASKKGVLRGLHFQINYPQDKLVRVVNGEVFDVAVDLREGSKTFGKWYGVRLSASAPSLHIIRANIHTALSPTVGSEQQGEELIKSLLSDFETAPGKLWSTNIFGKSLNELVSEGVQAKLLHMPQEARARLQQTLERIINEGCDGLICILL